MTTPESFLGQFAAAKKDAAKLRKVMGKSAQIATLPMPHVPAGPLSDEQIEDMLGEANRGYCIERADYFKAVRDAEAAHGIGRRASMQAEAPQATKDAEDAALVEAVAQVIYRQWSDLPGWKQWVPCGNSLRQDDARGLARETLVAARKSQGEQERTPEQLARDLQTNQEIDAMVEKMKQESHLDTDLRDAARYRWLRSCYTAANFDPAGLDLGPEGVVLMFLAPDDILVSADLDETIDDAIASVEKMKGEGA